MPEETWVGGDIGGMHSMAQSLTAAPDEMHGIVTALSSKVQALIDDAGWQGDAATKFAKKWSADSVTGGALAEATKALGDAIEELASTLEAIDKALYNRAHEARAKGVPIGADGRPPTVATSPNPSPDDRQMLTALDGYSEDYRLAVEEAKAARLVAEEKIRDVYDSIGPDGDGGSLTSSQGLTVGGYIRSLYAIPASRTREILKNADSELTTAQAAMKDTRADYKAAKKTYEAKGMNLPKGDPARVAHSSAAKELDAIRGKIKAAERGALTNPVSKAFDTQVGDLGKAAGTAGRLPKFLGFAKSLPVLGILTTGAGAALDTKADVDKGDSPERAAGVNYTAGYGGLAAGAGAAAAIALAPVEAPAVAVVSASTAVAVGAGSLIKEGFNEHWSEDIDKHGVVGGIATGVGNMGTNTAKDMSSLAAGIWHTVAG
ncbi:hypothetical protein INP57_15915 [Saccharopolyspora sp. HNM0986]|uniref:WXG100 family type VII secretion target n=1 Tax=Saccharopolyspora galaxeae TaxID=2781241 RepID=UPI00190DA5A3|nr:hypothetical protein [Saccharopolyspora sp. HNM0986]MBK0868300.1 hypothetical protein [Saccharopolyspora sp. HNM0986]